MGVWHIVLHIVTRASMYIQVHIDMILVCIVLNRYSAINLYNVHTGTCMSLYPFSDEGNKNVVPPGGLLAQNSTAVLYLPSASKRWRLSTGNLKNRTYTKGRYDNI
jgi:hypothetical protein